MIIEDHKIYKSIWLVGFLSYCLFDVGCTFLKIQLDEKLEKKIDLYQI